MGLSEVVETILQAYPKAVLMRNHQGSLPEDITKRLKHNNQLVVLSLLRLCRDEVITKRKIKHHRNRSEGCAQTGNEVTILDEQYVTNPQPVTYQTTENKCEIEVKVTGESSANNELMWI